jgi:hypothetical protein
MKCQCGQDHCDNWADVDLHEAPGMGSIVLMNSKRALFEGRETRVRMTPTQMREFADQLIFAAGYVEEKQDAKARGN